MNNVLILLSFLLVGCSSKLVTLGHIPSNLKTLEGKQIDELNSDYIIAKHKDKYYLGQFKYRQYDHAKKSKLLEKELIELTVDNKNIVKQVKKINKQMKDIKLNKSLPTMPDRRSIFGKLFSDIASVSVV